MSAINQAAVELFAAKAKPVSILVSEADSLERALDLAVSVCEKKPLAHLLLPDAAPDSARKKTLAAPGLDETSWNYLAEAGAKKGFEMIRGGLRNYLAGVDVTISVADLGVADTATCVLECPKEDDRLATMICETHVIALAKSKIVANSYEAESFLERALAKERNYTAFISGASRTADIERVLTLGVHGPLELHLVMIEA
ncbi:MAG: lactate utilization protein [Deltaproteobacteria bacterium]|jgi:L-lactate dehydrogenase complex protein LldG|nr:lactate utilization protein [Deltaproteobacteria bacterium]